MQADERPPPRRPLFFPAASLDSRTGRKETRNTRRKILEELAMIRSLLAAALALCAVFTLPARAQGGDPNLGRNLAAACANCHGTNGLSQQGMPSLAGQQRAYLAQQMQDFRSGKRPATIMHQLAKGYTDEQIDALAVYFSAQKAR
jgi:cytochrome c553